MADVTWDDYLPEVLISASGVPYVIAINAIRNAAIRFCEKTGIWKEDITAINVVAAQSDYTITPTKGEIINLKWATYNGYTLLMFSEEELDIEFNKGNTENWRLKTEPEAEGIYMYSYNTARLVPIPNVSITSGLLVGVTLKPSLDSTDGIEEIHKNWKDAIVLGALSRLHGMPGRPWYNPQESARERLKSDSEIRRAQIRVRKSGVIKSDQIRMRPIA